MATTKETLNPKNVPNIVTIFPGGGINGANRNGVQLPPDVMILLDGEKIIAESKILDGVSVFERVGRKPFNINFEFTIRQQNSEISTLLPNQNQYVFPQEKIEDLIQNTWQPNEVVQVKNTYLNGIGIDELIIKSVNLTTIRGNTNVLGSLRCLENYNGIDGQTLVIPL